MLRTPASNLVRSSLARASARPASLTACRTIASQAISKPTLANIEKRWEGLPLQEQAELWMALRDRMKENWAELTLHEKRAGELFKTQLLLHAYGLGSGNLFPTCN